MSLGIHVFARSAGMIEQDSATVPALRDGLPGLEPGTQVQILLSILGVALIFLVRRALLGWVRKGVDDTALQYRWTKISRYVALVLAVVYSGPQQRRGTEEVFWERILEAFAKSPDLEFAYPTRGCFWTDQSEQYGLVSHASLSDRRCSADRLDREWGVMCSSGLQSSL